MQALRQLQRLRITRPGRFWAALGVGGLACSILTTRSLPAQELPTDPAQRCATKALRGDYGELQAWQEAAYRMVLERGVRADRRALVTHYFGTEASGRRDRRGNPCSRRHAAANRVPHGTYVWTPIGVRQVLDCGARSNDRLTDARGADLWLDYWWQTPQHADHSAGQILPVAIIGGR